jgi:tetratricopeptide (TPR) repeat protein
VLVDPDNFDNWAELARIQTYASALMISTTDQNKSLADARDSISTANQQYEHASIQPKDFDGYAIQALVFDWSADPNLVDAATREQYLSEAYSAAVKALQLQPDDPLALAFEAEVLVDQSNWAQALDVGSRAAQLAPDLMDVHRAYAYVLESTAYYVQAIDEYLQAIRVNPNLPFLYLRLGANYRKIGETTTDSDLAKEMIRKALDAFARASELNPNDPSPYLSIANTYANEGEFFIAERNAQKALSLDKTNAYIYGRLGTIYYKAKNYEGAQKVLKCAVRGCTAAENDEQRVDVTGLPLAANSLDFYYIYGSVSAFYGDCTEAAAIFAELRASVYYDSTIEEIIQEGERICSALARQTPTP